MKSALDIDWRDARVRLNRWGETPAVRRALRLLQYGLLAGVIGYLIYRFTRVGWGEVIAAMPQSPWFFIFFAMRYLALPISELAIYEIIWGQPLLQRFPVFLRKRVYNFGVMGYAGEGFLTLWARRSLPISEKRILLGVKDNNLLSALASNISTVAVLIALAAAGGLGLALRALPPGFGVVMAIAFSIASILTISVIVFRRKLLALPDHIIIRLLAIHGVRMALILSLHAGMYAAAIPGAPFSAWLTILGVHLVISRIPLVPNQDIVFLGVAMTLAPLVNASEASFAAMLLAEGGLMQLTNLVLFFATAYLAAPTSKKKGRAGGKSAAINSI